MYADRSDWRLRLNDIEDSAEKILRYVHGMSFDTFSQDNRTIDAVVRNFEIIGEAARNKHSGRVQERSPSYILA